MSDEQGRLEAAARDWWEFDQGQSWIDPNGDQLYRQGYRDDTRRVLAAADRWDREHGYVRVNAATLAEALREAGVEVGSVGGEAFRMHIATHAIAAVLRAAGEDQ